MAQINLFYVPSEISYDDGIASKLIQTVSKFPQNQFFMSYTMNHAVLNSTQSYEEYVDAGFSNEQREKWYDAMMKAHIKYLVPIKAKHNDTKNAEKQREAESEFMDGLNWMQKIALRYAHRSHFVRRVGNKKTLEVENGAKESSLINMLMVTKGLGHDPTEAWTKFTERERLTTVSDLSILARHVDELLEDPALKMQLTNMYSIADTIAQTNKPLHDAAKAYRNTFGLRATKHMRKSRPQKMQACIDIYDKELEKVVPVMANLPF